MRRVVAAAIALLSITIARPAVPELRLGAAACGPTRDNGSPAWVEAPDLEAKSGTPRWTLDRVAAAGRGAVVEIGSNNMSFGMAGRIYPDVRGVSSSTFASFFEDGRAVATWEDLLVWMAQVRAICGSDCPRFVFNFRWDLASLQQVSRVGPWLPDESWFLRSARPASDFAAEWPTSPCHAPDTVTPQTDELWGEAGTTGCGAPYTGTGDGERNARIADVLAGIDAGLPEDAAYYFLASGSDAVVSFGLAVMMNLQDTNYRRAMVERCAAAIAAGFDACSLPHKNAQYCTRGTPTCTPVQLWPKISGDGLGGYGSGSTATLAEIRSNDGWSGPLLHPDGTTPWTWDDRNLGDVMLARDFDAAGLPTMLSVNPYWFKDCSLDHGDWESLFHDNACEQGFEGADGTYSETDQLREIAMRADILLIDTGGKSISSDSLGSGSGSGLSFPELRSLLLSVPSPDGTPPEVPSWITEGDLGQEDVDPDCIDPTIIPTTALPECGDGTTDASEECDDGNTTGGDGCSSKCRLPKVGVVIGQSNQMPLNSTQNQDLTTGNVTSPDTYSDGASRFFRFRHVYDTGGGYATWVPANEWPCADSQCTGTACTGQNRTAAGHPDSTAATSCAGGGTCTNGVCVGGSNPGVDCDGTCLCTCGSSAAATEHASAWPTFAQRWMQDAGTDVDLIFVVMGSTGLVCEDDGSGPHPLWDPYVTDCATRTWSGSGAASNEKGDLFCGIFEAIEVADVDPDWFLWLQGEEDATCSPAVTGVQYEAALTKLADELWGAYQAPIIAAPISKRENTSDATPTVFEDSGVDIIHDATESVIASHAHVYMGPDTDDLEHESGGNIHIKDVVELGKRWYEATAAFEAGVSYTGQPYVATSPDVLVADLRLACGAKTGSTYAAPVGCAANASGTVHTDPDVKIGDLRFLIDWDDSDLTTYTYGPAIPKQFATEPYASHIYTAAGTYDVTLTVTDAAGNTDTDTVQIVVTAQDTAYADADTRCVCASGLDVPPCTDNGVEGFAGCPLDNDGDGNCTDPGELSSQCVSSASVHNANAFWNSAGKRTLFRRGDTFNLGSLTPTDASSNGSMIGEYGSGAKPIFKLTSDASTLPAANGWKSVGIHYDGTDLAPDNDEFPQVWGRYSTGSSGLTDLLLYDNVMEGVGYGVEVVTRYYDPAVNERIFITGNDFTIEDAPLLGGYYLILFSGKDSGIWDNTFTLSYANGYNGVRTEGLDGVSFAHNLFLGLTTANMSIQSRHCSGEAGDGCTTREEDGFSFFGNVIDDRTNEGGWPLRWLNSHDGDASQAQPLTARKLNQLIRSNLYLASGTKANLSAVLVLDGVEGAWVENNVADLRGIPNFTSGTRFVQWDNKSKGTHGPSRIANNTIITSEGSAGPRTYYFADASAVTLTGINYVFSNLWWEEFTVPSMPTPTAGAWTLVSDNVYAEQAAQSPFYGTADNGVLSAFSTGWDLTRLLEARIRSTALGGQPLVVNEAYPPSLGPEGATLRDFRGFVRADSTPTVGAFEDGAVDDW